MKEKKIIEEKFIKKLYPKRILAYRNFREFMEKS